MGSPNVTRETRIRVIHVSPTDFGAGGLFGGGERFPLELARALSRLVDCKLVTFGSGQAVRRDGDLDIRVLRRSGLVRNHPAHPFGTGLMRELKGADVVHVHHLRALPSRIAAARSVFAGRQRVVTDHGLGGGRWPQVDARLFHKFLTVSRYSARTLNAPRSKTAVIYGGADPNRFRPDPGGPREGVLFVGRLTPHKGVDRLIEALPKHASLTIAGTGGHDQRPPERDYPGLLRRLAAGREVRFAETVSDSELPGLYRRARVLVLPSVDTTCYGTHVAIPELLGLVLLEAMASGTPVIASSLGGLPEVVEDGVTGFLVDPGNVEDLRERLEQLLGNDRLLAEMGENARRHVLANFTWDKCAERCLAVYKELIGAP